MLTKIINYLNLAFRWLAGVLLAGILLVLLLQIGLRATASRGFPWGNELATFLLVWAVCLSAASAFWERSHLGVDLLVSKLGRFRRPVEIFAFATAITFLAVLTYYGWSMTQAGMRRTSPALGLPMGWVYLSIPLSGAISILNLVAVIITRKEAESPGEEIEEEVETVQDISDMGPGPADETRFGDTSDPDPESGKERPA